MLSQIIKIKKAVSTIELLKGIKRLIPAKECFSILFLCTIVFNTKAETGKLDYINKNISVSALSNSSFRGKVVDEYALNSSIEMSGYGVSIGIEVSNNENDSDLKGYISYSYSVEEAVINVGTNYVEYFDYSQLEVFIELIGREDYWGYTPSFYLTQGLKEGTTYGEIGVSKDYVVDNWLLNLHTNVSFGQYHTNSFEMNHFDLGIDATTLMTEDVFLSFSVNAFTPLQAIKSSTGESGTEIQLGASIQFKF